MKKFLILILSIIFILSFLFVTFSLWILAVAKSHLYLNIFILLCFIGSIIYMNRCNKKKRLFIIILEIIIILFFIFTFLSNQYLISHNKKPWFFIKKIVYNESTEYLCLYYAITEVPKTLPDTSIKNYYILYSYQDRRLGYRSTLVEYLLYHQ